MKVLGVRNYKAVGDMSALEEIELPTPEPTGHDILVEIKAVATNPIDYKALGNLGNGEGKVDSEDPLVVGWDAAGVVSKVGPDATLFKVGDAVMFAGDFFRPGAFADYTLVDERIVGRKPSNLSWGQAAALPLTHLTAWESMVDQMHVSLNKEDNKSKTILITGGAGGVATASVEIAKKIMGLTVIATGSREESIDYIKKMGADHVINHREKLHPQLKELEFESVDYILDTYGLTPELFSDFSEIVKPFGHIGSIWPAAEVDLMKLFWKSINFSALLMFTRPGLPGPERIRQHEILNTVAKHVEDGTLTSKETSTATYSLENLKTALVAQASGSSIGKRTLTMP